MSEVYVGYRAALTDQFRAAGATVPVWCIFDNTARGAAARNALDVLRRLREAGPVNCLR